MMEGVMEQPGDFSRAARQIAAYTREHHRMTAEEVGRLFFDEGFFGLLYGGSDFLPRTADHPNSELLVIRSFTGRPVILFQFERPGTNLRSRLGELELTARATLGRALGLSVITNGRELWVFRMRDGRMWQQGTRFLLGGMSPEQTRAFVNFFQHCQVNWNRQLRSPRFW